MATRQIILGAVHVEITSSILNFRISLIEIETLRPHEEVIDSVAKSLANDIRIEGVVRDPLIVDQDKYVILDGMHRFSSLKSLNCRFAPCCLVDYDNPLIKVGSWFRTFSVKDPESIAEKLLTDTHLDYSREKIKLEEWKYNPETIILTGGMQFSLPKTTDLLEGAKTAVRLEEAMLRRVQRVDYCSESLSIHHLRSGDADLVITLPVFTKQEIIDFALRRILLPHKTTRHVMPSRPMRLDIPLHILKDSNINLAEADTMLRQLLMQRYVNRKPPGSIVDGRRYDEELLIFTTQLASNMES